MSVEDRRTFDIWIKRNAVAGTILAASLVAMSFLGSQQRMSPDGAVAGETRPAVVVATVTSK